MDDESQFQTGFRYGYWRGWRDALKCRRLRLAGDTAELERAIAEAGSAAYGVAFDDALLEALEKRAQVAEGSASGF